jgi:hypothetical protein
MANAPDKSQPNATVHYSAVSSTYSINGGVHAQDVGIDMNPKRCSYLNRIRVILRPSGSAVTCAVVTAKAVQRIYVSYSSVCRPIRLSLHSESDHFE